MHINSYFWYIYNYILYLVKCHSIPYHLFSFSLKRTLHNFSLPTFCRSLEYIRIIFLLGSLEISRAMPPWRFFFFFPVWRFCPPSLCSQGILPCRCVFFITFEMPECHHLIICLHFFVDNIDCIFKLLFFIYLFISIVTIL